MKEIVLVFVGGGLGSITRYLLGKGMGMIYSMPFPLGTWLANVTACFVLGFAIGAADKQIISPSMRLFLTVGFCGGFSTFSAFSFETLSLAQNGFSGTALMYVAFSLVVCIASTYVGLYLGGR